MAIEVEVFGQFAVGRQAQRYMEVRPGLTVQDLALQLGLKPEEVGMASIDGVLAQMHDRVPERGRVCFFPPMTGG